MQLSVYLSTMCKLKCQLDHGWGQAYNVSNCLGKYIHNLRLSVCCLRSIKEDFRAFVDDNESKIIHGSNLVLTSVFKSNSNTLMDGTRIGFISSISFWKAGNDCIFQKVSEFPGQLLGQSSNFDRK
jgi:hypothetical protein